MDILNLPGFSISHTDENADDMCVRVDPPEVKPECPFCGSLAVRFGSTDRFFMDLPVRGKRMCIKISHQRFRCKMCKRTFFQQLPHMDANHIMTERLVRWIEKKSLSRTFTSVADEVGVTEATIRNIFNEYVERLEEKRVIQTPRVLGIDEIHLIKPRCVLANVKERTVIDILPNRNKTTVVHWLYNKLKNREKVDCVCMDMWQPYRDAVNGVMPHAVVIVDKWHLLRMANQALDTIRKQYKEGLGKKERRRLLKDRFVLLKRPKELKPEEEYKLLNWKKFFPTIGTAYDLKESLFDIWDTSTTKEEAREKYLDWVKSIPESMEPLWNDLLTAVTNWDKEVFAYFEHRYTNAYTESLNSLIRVVDRLGRGYSFEALRAKILYMEGVQKVKRKRFNKSNFVDFHMAPGEEPPKDYEVTIGADISTLVKELTSSEQ